MRRQHQEARNPSEPARQWWVGPAVFFASLLSMPANAGITIPDDPLTTAARVAPNVLFILDDSGSMAFDYMPDSVPPTSTVDVSGLAYTRNTLSYDPSVHYQAWMKADGNRMTSGTSYAAAFGSFNLVGGTAIDLGNASSCQKFNRNSGNSSTNRPNADELTTGTNVCGGVQTFYVPKDTGNKGATYLENGTNYYRYQILSGGTDILRGTYGAVSTISPNPAVSPSSGSLSNGTAVTSSVVTQPEGRTLEITINNTTGNGTAGLSYWVYGPSGTQECSGSVARGKTTACAIFPTAAGVYKVTLQRANTATTSYSLSTRASTSCDGTFSGKGWVDCSSAMPSSRTLQDELTNYATWFSYHRTRIKAAKAGASEAFGSLGGKVRVGFRTIWGRAANHANPIPVNDGNDGRFVNNVANSTSGAVATTSRTQWYDSLQSVIGFNGTPLHGALYSAGEYFSGSSSSGAYGPQSSANQYSCRQNFAILTTDGYWNDTSSNYSSVGEQDNVKGSKITGTKGQTYTYDSSTDMKWPYAGSDSNTLADVAMKYWKNDLRTDSGMVNNVPTTDADPAFWQHMVTFGISIGLSGTRGWSSVDDVKNATSNKSWPNPNDAEDADRIDDLLHAAVNGRGTFVAASSPAEFTAGLSQALAAIAQRTGSFSNVATNSTSLDTGSQVFSASYVSGTWTGQVKGQSVDRTGIGSGWTSSIPAFASRKVFTVGNGTGTAFPTSAQQTALARTGGPADYAVSGSDNANYIKGDASREERNGGLLRNRPTTVLGDIVGSSPTYVKETGTLYVGANDGMLHAFDASSGRELFAYVPGILDFGRLGTLSRGDYAHKFFVDGPVVATSRALTPNKNILVGTLGRGGKGVYALDVTNPNSATAASVYKWEKVETPGNNMGLVLGRPILAKVQGVSAAVVMGNGINSANNKAVLLVLNADTGAVVREIDTGVGSDQAPNGLSAPVGVYGSDGKTLAYVYAGDMLGNVWKFDMTQWTAKKLFTAKSADDTVQPISAAVTIATHPLTGKRWVFFGTGRYLTEGDAASDSTEKQSMYGFIEEEAAASTSGLLRSGLTKRTVKITSATQSGYSVRAFEEKAALPAGSKGWYVDLPDSGERIVQDAQVVSTFLVTASMVPTGNACDADGRGYINALDAFTGTSANGSYFDLDNKPETDDRVQDIPIGSVDAGVGMPTLPNLLRGLTLLGGSSGSISALRTLSPRWDRVSWRELKREQ